MQHKSFKQCESDCHPVIKDYVFQYRSTLSARFSIEEGLFLYLPRSAAARLFLIPRLDQLQDGLRVCR